MIKAMIIKDETLNLNGRQMNHMPFARIYSKMLSVVRKKICMAEIRQCIKYRRNGLVMEIIRRDKWLRNVFWKLSLDAHQFEIEGDMVGFCLKRFDGYSRLFKFDEVPPATNPKLKRLEDVHIVFRKWNLNECESTQHSMKKLYEANDPYAMVLGLLQLYLFIYPHEMRGRYSEGVDGTNSYEWYELKKDNLAS